MTVYGRQKRNFPSKKLHPIRILSLFKSVDPTSNLSIPTHTSTPITHTHTHSTYDYAPTHSHISRPLNVYIYIYIYIYIPGQLAIIHLCTHTKKIVYLTYVLTHSRSIVSNTSPIILIIYFRKLQQQQKLTLCFSSWHPPPRTIYQTTGSTFDVRLPIQTMNHFFKILLFLIFVCVRNEFPIEKN